MNKLIAFGLASLLSFSLFLLMTFLIDSEAKAVVEEPEPVINFDIKLSDLTPTEKKPIKREPPEFKELLPTPQVISQENKPKTSLPKVAMLMPANDSQAGFKPGIENTSFTDFGKENPSELGMAPSIRVEPQYPPEAIQKEVEGFVTLQFDIDETGSPANIVVLDSKPKGYFEKASRKAVRKWKFNPPGNNSESVLSQVVTLDFKLEKAEKW